MAVHSLAASGENTRAARKQRFVRGCMETKKTKVEGYLQNGNCAGIKPFI